MSEQGGSQQLEEDLDNVKDDDDKSTKSEVSRIGEGEEEYEGEEFGGEEELEEEEPRELEEGKKSIDDLDLDEWHVPSYHSLGYEEYRELFYEGEEEEEVGEEEKIIPLSPVFSIVEPRIEYVFDELHPEADDEREEIIDAIRDLHIELADLKRKNKLLEVWVLRCMKKNEQKMTRTDPTKSYEDLEEQYKEALKVYKMQTEDIQSQQNELMLEMQNYINKVQSIRAETHEAFRELLDREKDVAVDLVFEKTGKKVTEKMMNALTRRQVLSQDRRKFIVLKHYLEDLKARLKSVETLGEGMTTMDYEALHVANISYKDKLDERDQELEKLRDKIAKTVNGVAQYKEKEVCLAEDIIVEEKHLITRRHSTTRIREQVNNARMKLKALREDFNEKKIEAGLLVALPELMEMEKKMGLRDNLKKGIDAIEREIGLYKRIKKKRSKLVVRKDTSMP